MQLPIALRQSVDRELHGIPLSDLARAGEALSRRYRAETRDGRLHLDDELSAKAYLTTRLPATFAAISAAMGAIVEAAPNFRPRGLLDVGAGPGTGTWAAVTVWEGLQEAHLVEASPIMRVIGERLSHALGLRHVTWTGQRVDIGLSDAMPADLVVLAYVLNELAPALRAALIARLWDLTAGVLLVVEPGTVEGWKRMLAARDALIAAGAHVLAPCPHAAPCPLAGSDWCHFPARVARSRLHREAKGGSVPWEDEKFIYLAVSRHPAARPSPGRIVAPPRLSKVGATLKLCEPTGTVHPRSVAKRDRSGYAAARKLSWGDPFALPDPHK